jgi:hypothetical protein
MTDHANGTGNPIPGSLKKGFSLCFLEASEYLQGCMATISTLVLNTKMSGLSKHHPHDHARSVTGQSGQTRG